MNSTELINYAIDTQNDYTIKLLWLVLFAIYSLWCIWYWDTHPVEYLAQWYVKMITLILAKVYFVALPLWILFLQRTVPIDVILQPLLLIYSIAMTMFMIYLFLYGGEKIKEFFSGSGFWRNR